MTPRGRKILARSSIALLAIAAVVLVTGRFAGFGCASSPTWNPTTPTTAPSPSERLAGQWLGRWASSKSDMDGELRAVITPIGDNKYQAHFDAVFGKIFTSRQEVVLIVHSKGDSWEFGGEQDLGFLKGGVYKYLGRSDGTDFNCSYDSAYDKGTFTMKRITASTPPATQPSSK